LTILTMMDRRLLFDTPVTVIHSVLSQHFVTSFDELIFLPSAILLLRYYTNTKPHTCTFFPPLQEDTYPTVILFCN
jgi:hypothetical protein